MLLALAPLLHFLPSKRQRHQARLRETAALAGLFVEFRDLPLPAAQRERLPAAERQVLYYGCRFQALRGEPPTRVAWYRREDAWASDPMRNAVPAWLEAAPAAVLAAGVNRDGCGFYWREEGDEELVQELASRLLAWRDELVA